MALTPLFHSHSSFMQRQQNVPISTKSDYLILTTTIGTIDDDSNNNNNNNNNKIRVGGQNTQGAGKDRKCAYKF